MLKSGQLETSVISYILRKSILCYVTHYCGHNTVGSDSEMENLEHKPIHDKG